MDSSATFSHFLQEKAILSQRQAEKLLPASGEDDENQNIFKLADFFRSLTPSDCYDLALRLYLLWRKSPKVAAEKEKALQRLAKLMTRKVKQNAFSTFVRNSLQIQPHTYAKSRSPSTSDDGEETGSTNNYNSMNNTSIFNYLYNEAQRKNYAKFENEQRKITQETEGCTFQPNLDKTAQSIKTSPAAVFERLQQDLRKEKEQINSAKKTQIELRGCTFKPQLVTKTEEDGLKSPDANQTFDRLYKEHRVKKNLTLENELKRQTLETKDCTFQPALSTRNGRPSINTETSVERSNKLYKLHSERQRSLMKKRIEQTEEEVRKCTFKPTLMASPARRSDSKDVRERLLEWNNEKNRKIEEKQKEKLVTEQNMHELNLPTKRRNDANETHDSISAYDRLYLDGLEKKIRHDQLEKRVLRDIGASFTPKTNVGRNSSAKKAKENVNTSSYSRLGESHLNFSRDEERIKSTRQKSPPPQRLYKPKGKQNNGSEVEYKRNLLEDINMNINGSKTATFGHH